jgi:hypothetical protein
MANVYNISKFNLCNGNLDLDATGTDLRLLLLLSSGPPQFNADDATIQAVLAQTYHTECTASGYSRTALTGEVTSNDTGNDRTDCSANKVTFTSVASGQTIGAADQRW